MSPEAKDFLKLRRGIMKGFELSFKKLVLQTRKEKGKLYFSRNGKVVGVEARYIRLKK
jgi:hypothetical protein